MFPNQVSTQIISAFLLVSFRCFAIVIADRPFQLHTSIISLGSTSSIKSLKRLPKSRQVCKSKLNQVLSKPI